MRTSSSRLLCLSLFVSITSCTVQTAPSGHSLSSTGTQAPATAKDESTAILEPTARHKPTATFEPYTLPLSDFGQVFIGKRTYDFFDASRADRPVGITIWYPAIKPEGYQGTSQIDAEPDLVGAPYAVILSSTKLAGFFGSHMVTHRFVVISVNKIDTYMPWDENMVDQPLDLLFALNQVRSNPPEGLDGLFDFLDVGAMGYSFDGYNALALSGARIDPEYFLSACSASPPNEDPLLGKSWRFQCPLAATWDAFTEHAGLNLTESEDGLWQPMTDPAIKAVMPLAPDGWRLFGERGLAAVDRAVLIIVAENDGLYPEDALIYENLGTQDRFLVSIAGKGHMMIYDESYVLRMKHFAVAFFGAYLQGRQDYAHYFSQDFVEQYPDLHWGTAGNE